jgi:hypothetical protein
VDGLEIDLGLYAALFIAKPLPYFLRYRSARLHRNRLRLECPKDAFPLEINLYPWCSIFWLPRILNPPSWRTGMGPCGGQSRQSRETMRMMLVRLRWPRRRRSCAVMMAVRPGSLPCASRSAFCTVVRCTPALAAMASMCRVQHPCTRHSSPTMRITAISPHVNRAARGGGRGPDATRRRRRSMLACLSGDR